MALIDGVQGFDLVEEANAKKYQINERYGSVSGQTGRYLETN